MASSYGWESMILRNGELHISQRFVKAGSNELVTGAAGARPVIRGSSGRSAETLEPITNAAVTDNVGKKRRERMRAIPGALAVTLLVTFVVAADDHLAPTIGPPNRALYRSIRGARAWQNPIIIVQDDGVDVQAKGVTGINGSKHVAVEELKALLASLPVSAWPYGRVVAQTDQGILPVPFDEYLRKMSQTRQRVAVVLKALRISVEFWPS